MCVIPRLVYVLAKQPCKLICISLEDGETP